MRSALRTALVAVLGLGLLTLALPASTASATPSTAMVQARAATASVERYGVSYGERLSRMPGDQMRAVLDDAVTLGVRWIRVDFSWTTIQPQGPRSFEWAGTDRVVNAARARGLKVLPILTYTPAWARNAGCVRFSCPPRSTAEFTAFAKAAVRRYKDKGVRVWEIWNEPNLEQFWPSPNARRYAALLKAASKGIRSVAPRAMVLLGGLAALENRPPSIGPRQFLAAVCKAGACGSMDAVSYHPYTFPFTASYDATWSAWTKISETDWSLRSILDRHGFRGKGVWVTEYGAPTRGLGTAADGTWATVLPTTTHVTEAWQAVLATDVVDQAQRNPDVRALFWYTNQDLEVLSAREASFGLRRLDGTPKPAWATYKAAVAAASLR
jgi:arabinogalactan endo-1,4-beta-galactosidase